MLFAPAALAAVGAEKIALAAGVRSVDVLRGGGHDVLAAGGTNEGAGIAIEGAGDKNAANQLLYGLPWWLRGQESACQCNAG